MGFHLETLKLITLTVDFYYTIEISSFYIIYDSDRDILNTIGTIGSMCCSIAECLFCIKIVYFLEKKD